ncbi:MAG: hynB [Deltaproteobacteria bacterium]|nr:hynB [Deltaproteobacteria bacterium]
MLTKRGNGLSRRDFMRLAGGTVASLGLSATLTPKLARALEKAAAGRPKVVWLHFASDTGCTESWRGRITSASSREGSRPFPATG